MQDWTRYQPAVLALTFSSKVLLHVVRKTPSVVKARVISEWTPSPLATRSVGGDGGGDGGDGVGGQGGDTWTRVSFFADEASAEAFLGLLNATFLFVYALGVYVSGALADRLDQRLMLSGGMALSGLALFLFGPTLHWTAAWSQPAYLGLMALCSLMQSAGWPCVVAVMAAWFRTNNRSRGCVLGIWSCSANVGSIICALMASAVVDFGYEYVFVVSTSMAVAGSLAVFFGLVTSPREVGLSMPDEAEESIPTTAREESSACRETREKSTCGVTVNKNISYTAQRSVDVQRNRRCITPHSSYGSTRQTPSSEIVHQEAAQQCSTGISLLCKVRIPKRWPRMSNEEVLLLSGEDEHMEDRNSYADTNLDVDDEDEPNERESPFLKTSENDLAAENPTGQSQLGSTLETECGQPITDAGCEDTEASSNNVQSHYRPRAEAINFLNALRLPGVVPYSSAYAFIKMSLYIFYFWLPFYLTSAFGWSQATADKFSVLFDVGSIVGSTVAGALISFYGKQDLVLGPMVALAVPTLYLYGILPIGQRQVVNAVLLIVQGALIGGVCNIFAVTISSDLGSQDASREAVSTVTGIIEGTGTLGAVVGQLVVPHLAAAFGWSAVFYLMMAAMSLGVLNLLPMMVNELREVVKNRRS